MNARTEIHVTCAAALAFAVFGGALAWGATGRGDTFLLLVFAAGSLGATVNNFRHLRELEERGAADSGIEPSLPRLYGSVIVGGVLGFSMYALCVSGLLGGTLFPAFRGTDANFTSVQDFVNKQGPWSNYDAAKALIWAFIAGWHRGALPAFLSRIVHRESGAGLQRAGRSADEKSASTGT